jgi:prevent-host-death family protein
MSSNLNQNIMINGLICYNTRIYFVPFIFFHLAFQQVRVYTLECIQEDFMEVSTKELRIQPGKIIDQVVNGEEITVTFRGKALAKIVPFKKRIQAVTKDEISIFGLWKDHDQIASVDDYIRDIRKGSQF